MKSKRKLKIGDKVQRVGPHWLNQEVGTVYHTDHRRSNGGRIVVEWPSGHFSNFRGDELELVANGLDRVLNEI